MPATPWSAPWAGPGTESGAELGAEPLRVAAGAWAAGHDGAGCGALLRDLDAGEARQAGRPAAHRPLRRRREPCQRRLPRPARRCEQRTGRAQPRVLAHCRRPARRILRRQRHGARIPGADAGGRAEGTRYPGDPDRAGGGHRGARGGPAASGRSRKDGAGGAGRGAAPRGAGDRRRYRRLPDGLRRRPCGRRAGDASAPRPPRRLWRPALPGGGTGFRRRQPHGDRSRPGRQ